MYKTIMLDGEEIKIRLDLDEKETGIVIYNNLNDTDDYSDVVKYIDENIIKEEESNYE